MNISIITVFQELYDSFLRTSLVSRAQKQNNVTIDVVSFRSHVQPKERIDAPTFGPGSGMLIKPEVVEKAIASQDNTFGKSVKVFFSPQGQKITQKTLQQLYDLVTSRDNHLMLLPARYEGMDARVEDEYADMVLSVGDFVLMGGDLPAMMLIEGLLRLIPGVIGKESSVQQDSFMGPFVDYPSYTEPVEWKGRNVPAIVRSGDHGAIEQWRNDQAVQKTVKSHFTWMRSCHMSAEQKRKAAQYIPPHYVVLMHDNVLVGSAREPGVTSVTSIDIHDIARSSRTYGIEHFFVVTPLKDQQNIVNTLLDFWVSGPGESYNSNRKQAVEQTSVVDNLSIAIDQVKKEHDGLEPIIVATSAQLSDHNCAITYYDQATVWKENRPVIIIFGTGQGLQQELIDRCDYILLPVHGFSDFNHLSVRSAVAIILDRWLGISEKSV